MTMPSFGGKPFQSKLIPFTDQIRSWRRQRKTYVEISRLLAEQGVSASPSTIFSFVKVRSRHRGFVTMLEPSPGNPGSHGSIDSQDAIAALKRKSSPPPFKQSFRFDETKPLTLQSK